MDQNDINIDKSYPLTDSEGNQLIPYTFTVKNVCNRSADYEINIETTNTSSLSTNYLKYKLDDSTAAILGNEQTRVEYVNQNIK